MKSDCEISRKILFKDGSTRHIYVYHDDPQTVVNWYHAIRCCKLHLLQVLFMIVMQIHPKLQELCYDSPTSYKNPSMILVICWENKWKTIIPLPFTFFLPDYYMA